MSAALQTLHEIVDEPGRFRRAVFRLQTNDGRAVFMKVGRNNGLNASRFVVEVDADRLLTLWKRDAFAPPSVHGRQRWSEDYKYDRAEEGFSRGQRNPVGLAKVYVRDRPVDAALPPAPRFSIRALVRSRKPGRPATQPIVMETVATLNDGCTRTIWLLANGVATFPVECDGQASAERLQHLAGVGSPILSIDQLLPLLAGDQVNPVA